MQIQPAAQYLRSQELSRSFPDRFWSKVECCGDLDCWLWKASTHLFGYGQIWRGYPFHGLLGAHVASWILNRGPVPKGMCVLHKCPGSPNPACVNPDHLYLGTKKDNAQDRERAGRGVYGHTRGERNAMTKLCIFDVRNMRYLRATYGLSYTELGRLYGISDVAARLIVLKRSWKHVT